MHVSKCCVHVTVLNKEETVLTLTRMYLLSILLLCNYYFLRLLILLLCNYYFLQLTHTVMVPTLDKEVDQSYLIMWHVMGQSHPSSSVATMVFTATTVITVRMLVLCAQEVGHIDSTINVISHFGGNNKVAPTCIPLWQFHVHMERSVLLGDLVRTKGELRFVTIECGELCVTMDGALMMPKLSADSWDMM